MFMSEELHDVTMWCFDAAFRDWNAAQFAGLLQQLLQVAERRSFCKLLKLTPKYITFSAKKKPV